MAQTGYTPIQLYYSTTASAVPTNTNLANGELAINITDGKLYYKDNTGTVKLLAGAGGAGIAGGSNTQVQYNSSGNLAGSANMTFDGTSLTLGGNPTLSAGTANGVTYLNGSKVLTSGSALTFNGTSLGIGSSSYGDAGTITASIGVAGTTAGGLQLWASSAQEHFIQWGDSTTGSATYAGAISYSHASDFMRFWTNSTEQMRLTSTGLGIGLGGSSPSVKLQSNVARTSGTNVTAFVLSDTVTGTQTSGYGTQIQGWSNNGSAISAIGFEAYGGTNNDTALGFYTQYTAGGLTRQMTIDSSGFVGIGTGTPTVKLDVVGPSGTEQFRIGNTTGGTDFGITVNENGNTVINSAEGATGRGIQFQSGGTNTMLIDSTGNVGIGTSSPADTSSFGRALDIQSSGGAAAYFRASGTNPSTEYLAIGYSPTAAYFYNRANSPMYFYTNATEHLRIAASGAFGLSGPNYGTAGQVLTSQGSGSPPIWASGGGGGGSPGGSNTQVQYNSSGSFAGSANFTFNGTGITTGFFAPSSSSAPATGISLPSADTLGFSSASQGNGMFFKTFQIGSTGVYANQLSIGNSINTSYYSNLYVYAQTTAAAQAKSTDGPGQLYSGNNNTPYRTNQVIEAATSGFSSAQYCPVGLESVSRSSGGWQPTQFPTGSFQTFTNIGVYGEAQGSSGYPLGTGFYAFAGSYYANATGFYARTASIAPTSGSSFCYRSDIGPHVFGGNMVGYHSRVISGQGSNSNYQQTIGWWHSDETANGVGGIAARFEKAGSVVGTITLTTSATSYNTSSDPRLKDISGPVTSDEAKAFVMGLQPKQGTWKADGSRFCGFLSTDYELIDPSGVSGVAGATEVVGNLIDKDGKVINEDVVEPTPDALPEGGRWERTRVRDIYQTLEYGSAAWCANMTAHAQYLQTTIEQLVNRISALENK